MLCVLCELLEFDIGPGVGITVIAIDLVLEVAGLIAIVRMFG